MNIPNLPILTPLFNDPKLVAQLHPAWMNFFTQLIQELQGNVSNEGYKIPALTADQIIQIENQKSNTALVYDSDNNVLRINLNGTFKTITTS